MNISRFLRVSFIFSAFLFSELALQAAPSFLKESGIRLSSASPQVVLSTSSNFYRMFFIRDYEVRSATSSDQLTWGVENAVSLSSSDANFNNSTSSSPITGCAVAPLSGGGYRMIYTIGLGTGPYAVMSATSSDGLMFGSTSTVASLDFGSFPLYSPKVVVLSNGDWRLYYTVGVVASTAAIRGAFTVLSTNEGASWDMPPTYLNLTSVGEVAVSTRTDNRIRLYYTSPPLSLSTTTRINIFSELATNSNSASFSAESDARLSTAGVSGTLSNPVVVRSTENYRYRLFYNFDAYASTSPSNVFSALTSTADVRSVSPSVVENNTTGVTLTLGGEIFSPAPTVKLARAGQTDINGTSVNQVTDQSVTFDINPFAADIGDWDLVFTNDDGQAVTRTNFVTITFPAGEIDLTDNLIRPRLSNATTIDVLIYVEGQLKVQIFTIEGKLVKTIYDGTAPAGTTTRTWDGTNDQGQGVASGTYLVKATGPKLDTIKKIIVIR
jgi:hypothetical protein